MDRDVTLTKIDATCDALEAWYRDSSEDCDLLEDRLLELLRDAPTKDVLAFVEVRLPHISLPLLCTIVLLLRFVITDGALLRATILIIGRIFELVGWLGTLPLGMDDARNQKADVERAESSVCEYLTSIDHCSCEALKTGILLDVHENLFLTLAELTAIQAWISFTGGRVPCDLEPLRRQVAILESRANPIWLEKCIAETLVWFDNFESSVEDRDA